MKIATTVVLSFHHHEDSGHHLLRHSRLEIYGGSWVPIFEKLKSNLVTLQWRWRFASFSHSRIIEGFSKIFRRHKSSWWLQNFPKLFHIPLTSCHRVVLMTYKDKNRFSLLNFQCDYRWLYTTQCSPNNVQFQQFYTTQWETGEGSWVPLLHLQTIALTI